jgi:hypothetical protein
LRGKKKMKTYYARAIKYKNGKRVGSYVAVKARSKAEAAVIFANKSDPRQPFNTLLKGTMNMPKNAIAYTRRKIKPIIPRRSR